MIVFAYQSIYAISGIRTQFHHKMKGSPETTKTFCSPTIEVFHTKHNKWSVVTRMPDGGLCEHQATSDSYRDTLYIYGGYQYVNNNTNERIEYRKFLGYNVKTKTWMNYERRQVKTSRENLAVYVPVTGNDHDLIW